mgnify:CR=1 FL=1
MSSAGFYGKTRTKNAPAFCFCCMMVVMGPSTAVFDEEGSEKPEPEW